MKSVLFLLNTMPDEGTREGIINELNNHEIQVCFADISKDHYEVKVRDRELIVSDEPRVVKKVRELGEDVLIYLHSEDDIGSYDEGKFFVLNPEECDAQYFANIYKRIHNLPWEIGKTERLTIRETTKEDVDVFYRLYDDPLVKAYMDPLYDEPEKERAYAAEYIERVYTVQEFGIWTLIETKSGEIIGRGGLNFRSGLDNIEIGFMIGADYRRQGYATEAIDFFLSFAKERGYTAVNALVAPENEPSHKLLFSLGFEYEMQAMVEGKTYDILCCGNF